MGFNKQAAVLILALITGLGGCVTAPISSQDSELQLRKQADDWDRAIVRKDVSAISRNMSESFQQIDSRGGLSNKAQFLAAISSVKLVITPYQAEDIVIRFYGKVALITGTTDLHGTYDGKPFRTHYRYTDTYAKESGVWRVVNVQTTEMSD